MKKVFIITLKYQNKEYECEGVCWYDEDANEWRSPFEFDGVRSCEHDYASLLPRSLVRDKDFGCVQKEIEVIDYKFLILNNKSPKTK